MKKHALPAFAAAALLVMSAAVHAEEFKCFVAGADGERYIVFNEAQDMGEARRMAKEQKVQIGVPRPIAVTRVFECAKLGDEFLDGDANRLDAATPR